MIFAILRKRIKIGRRDLMNHAEQIRGKRCRSGGVNFVVGRAVIVCLCMDLLQRKATEKLQIYFLAWEKNEKCYAKIH
jgi:hypothetical protein